MAQTRSSPEVDQWVQATMGLIDAAGQYAEAGIYEAETDGMIRRVRVIGAAFMAAINGIQFPRIPPPPEPAPPQA